MHHHHACDPWLRPIIALYTVLSRTFNLPTSHSKHWTKVKSLNSLAACQALAQCCTTNLNNQEIQVDAFDVDEASRNATIGAMQSPTQLLNTSRTTLQPSVLHHNPAAGYGCIDTDHCQLPEFPMCVPPCPIPMPALPSPRRFQLPPAIQYCLHRLPASLPPCLPAWCIVPLPHFPLNPCEEPL